MNWIRNIAYFPTSRFIFFSSIPALRYKHHQRSRSGSNGFTIIGRIWSQIKLDAHSGSGSTSISFAGSRSRIKSIDLDPAKQTKTMWENKCLSKIRMFIGMIKKCSIIIYSIWAPQTLTFGTSSDCECVNNI